MYKDIITYTLAEGVNQDQLLTVAREVYQSRMSKLPGFVSREIHQIDDRHYVDIVYRNSKEDAKNAENDMANIPNGDKRYTCYAPDSITSQSATQISHFGE